MKLFGTVLVLTVASASCQPWAGVDLTALGEPVAFSSLAAGDDRTCGSTANGATYCWGRGVIGTLRATDLCDQMPSTLDPSYVDPPVECIKRPIPVAGNHRFASLVAGPYATFALDDAGGVWAWGWNFYGILGEADLDLAKEYPRQVGGAETISFQSIGAGYVSTCGVATEGRLLCWGERNLVTARVPALLPCAEGLGKCVVAPTAIGSGSWKQVAVGREHACALDGAGVAHCWGNGQRGQLGSSSLASCAAGAASIPCRLDPTPVAAAAQFTSLSAANDFTCGVSTTGQLWCWGTGAINAPVPLRVGTASDWISVSVGGGIEGGPAVCGVRTGGAWWCFGLSQVGGLSVNPRQIGGVPPMLGVVVGDDHACGWTADGEAWCFGDAHNAALGHGEVAHTFITTPVRVSAPYRD